MSFRVELWRVVVGVVGLVGVLLIAGCTTYSNTDMLAEPHPAKPLLEIIPLRVGNSWHYQINGISSKIESDYVEQQRLVGGMRWYLINIMGRYRWVRNDSEGQFVALDDIQEGGRLTETILYKYPFAENENYSLSNTKVNVQTCAEAVVVPIGEFNCVKYTFLLNTGDYIIHYIAPGLGIIKSENYNDGQLKVAQLKLYRLHQ